MSKTMSSGMNPVDLTAQARLLLLSASGLEEASEVVQALELDLDVEHFRQKLLPGLITERLLYEATLAYIRATDCKNVMELSCGYSPLGWKLASEGYNYVGADVPLLAETMKLATEEKGVENCRYTPIDYFNEASLFAAADMLDGPITLITQGLTSAMTMDQKLLALEGIGKVMADHGGVWFMPDMDARKLTQGTRAIIKGTEGAAKKTGKWTMTLDALGWQDSEESLPALNSLGFSAKGVTLLPPEAAIPAELYVSAEQREKILAVARAASLGCITVETAMPRNQDAEFYVHLEDSTLVINILGRVASNNAPEMQACFHYAELEGGFTDILLDLTRLEYISSAGLRVLLVMKKSLGDGVLRVRGVNSTLKDIFASTGFDALMEIEE